MSADRAYNCQIVHIELFIDEMGWSLDDLETCLLGWFWPWALSLDEDIYNARDSCTSHATENIDYLTNTEETPKDNIEGIITSIYNTGTGNESSTKGGNYNYKSLLDFAFRVKDIYLSNKI